MARTKIVDLATVREIAMKLPDVEESTAWGTPAFKVRGEWFAVVPSHKSAEPGSLGVRVDFDQRAELLESAPDVYYVKEHYVNYPVVLVRLARIKRDALEGLLRMGYQYKTRKKSKRK